MPGLDEDLLEQENDQYTDGLNNQGPDPDEEETAAYAQQLEQQRREEEIEAYNQQQRIQQQNSVKNQLVDVAKDQIKKQAKNAIWEFLIATWEVWVPALLILVGIVALIGVVVIIPPVVCNSGVTDAGSIKEAIGVGTAKAVFTASGICSAFNTGTPTTTTSTTAPPTGSTGGSDAAKRQQLLAYLITVNKADCPTATDTNCTSLDNTSQNTLQEIIRVTQACDISLGGNGSQNKCGVVVTGGSEAGHVGEVTGCSHSGGFKMDVSASNAFTTYIENNFTAAGARGGTHAGERFSDPSITSSFVLESTPAHWDISVGCIG